MRSPAGNVDNVPIPNDGDWIIRLSVLVDNAADLIGNIRIVERISGFCPLKIRMRRSQVWKRHDGQQKNQSGLPAERTPGTKDFFFAAFA